MRKLATPFLAAIALVSLAISPTAAAEMGVDTPSGPIIITTLDNDVAVTVREGGKQIILEDGKTGKKLVVTEGALHHTISDDLNLTASQFTLERGDKVLVEVRKAATNTANIEPPRANGNVQQAVVSYHYDAKTGTYTPVTHYFAVAPSPAMELPPAAPLAPAPQENADQDSDALPKIDLSRFDSEEALRKHANEVDRAEDYAKAIVVWNEYLRRYPNTSTDPAIQRKIGLAYWRLARVEDERSRSSNDRQSAQNSSMRRTYLGRSLDAFSAAERAWIARLIAGQPLTDAEREYLKQVSFWKADCYFWAANKEEANRHYSGLALRYKDCPEEMIAMSQQWQCLVALYRPTQAQQQLNQMRQRLPAIHFKGGDDTRPTSTRDYWDKWLAEAAKSPQIESVPKTAY